MAFDLYAGDMQLSITPSDEFIFQLASEKPNTFPELTKLWRAFYDDPSISSEQAGWLVHELIELGETPDGPKALQHTVHRMLPFFSRAYRQALDIKCRSD